MKFMFKGAILKGFIFNEFIFDFNGVLFATKLSFFSFFLRDSELFEETNKLTGFAFLFK